VWVSVKEGVSLPTLVLIIARGIKDGRARWGELQKKRNRGARHTIFEKPPRSARGIGGAKRLKVLKGMG